LYGKETADQLLTKNVPHENPAITVRELLENFASKENRTTQYLDYVRRMDLFGLENKRARKVTQADIDNLVRKLQAKGNAPKTVKDKIYTLSGAFKMGIKNQSVLVNPCLNVELPRPVKRHFRPLDYSRLHELISLFDEFYQSFFLTLFLSGLRFSEITALTPDDLDPTTRSIFVSKAWTDRGTRIGQGKTSNAIRNVPIPKSLFTALVKKELNSEFLFSEKDGTPINYYHIRKRTWAPVVRKFGQNLRIHEARHSYASYLLQSGVPISTVSKLLGHASIQTTVDTYGHIMPEVEEQIERVFSQVQVQSILD
jgi:integrase